MLNIAVNVKRSTAPPLLPSVCYAFGLFNKLIYNKNMATFETVEPGTIALIQQTPEGRILQIGLTPAQSNMLQFFLAKLSEESKLIQMPEEYDLILKSSLCPKCRKS